MNSKEKEESKKKLEIFAKKLMKEIGSSISDEGRLFTGNPLQSCMLAEAFDEEIKTFYQSSESVPNSPLKLDVFGL
jgi:hypothetical protein